MTTRRNGWRTTLATIVFAASSLAATPSWAADSPAGPARDLAIGAEGEFFVATAGVYGDLFPAHSSGAGLADPANTALALEIHYPGHIERLLVPGTETEDVEDSPVLLFEDESNTLFVLWQSKINLIHGRLNLIEWKNGTWSDTIELSGNPFGWKSSLQLAVTRDSFATETESAELRTWKRTVVHLLWWEEGGVGPRVLYSPVVFIDGEYVGWNPVYYLDELSSAAASVWGGSNSFLAQAPSIAPGVNGQSVVAAFVNSGSGTFLSLSIELLPGEIGHLADRARHQIIDIGRKDAAQEPAALADRVRHQIIDIGRKLGLHPGFTAYAAEQAAVTIAGRVPGDDVEAVADDVRHQIIDIGAQIRDGGVARKQRGGEAARVLVISGENPSQAIPPSLVRVGTAASRPVPATAAASHAVYVSKTGREAIVAWPVEGALRYRESQGAGWSAVRTLVLDDEMRLERAHEILRRRAEGLSAGD